MAGNLRQRIRTFITLIFPARYLSSAFARPVSRQRVRPASITIPHSKIRVILSPFRNLPADIRQRRKIVFVPRNTVEQCGIVNYGQRDAFKGPNHGLSSLELQGANLMAGTEARQLVQTKWRICCSTSELDNP